MMFTKFLNLFKYDPVTDGAQTFNIQLSLNDNWDKIATWAAAIAKTLEQLGLDVDDLAEALNNVQVTVQGEAGQLIVIGSDGEMTARDMVTPSEIGAAPMYTYGIADITAGSTALETGKLYLVYE